MAAIEVTGVRRLNNGHYLFDSASRPGVQHETFPFETGTGWDYTCSCEASRFNRVCWHVRAAREEERKRQTAPATGAVNRDEMMRKMARFARN